jgi:hypothetical protein
VYYREGQRPVRRRLGRSETDAERVAAEINAQLAAETPTLLAFTPISVAELRQRFLDHHEHVATIRRYRAATQHLQNFAHEHASRKPAHELQAEPFVAYLRNLLVAPNGHPHARHWPLRDKGVRYIVECCRALYAFARRQRHLPLYADNPFSGQGLKRIKIANAKPIFVFDATSELAFLQAAGDWAFTSRSPRRACDRANWSIS